jgi:hypothetical protein
MESNFFNKIDFSKKRENTLKGEHLKSGIKPIIGGIYNINEFNKKDSSFIYKFKNNAVFVDFYVISKVDSKNKFSERFLNCTSVVAIGKDKNTGENISFMSHQNPNQFLKDNSVSKSFKSHLNESLDYILEKSEEGTVDVVLLGGNKNVDWSEDNIDLNKLSPQEIYNYFENVDQGPFDEYRKSINFLGRNIYEKFGFYPTVLTGPNSNIKIMKDDDIKQNNTLTILCDTKNRRVYQIRPENESLNNESFESNEINERSQKYK